MLFFVINCFDRIESLDYTNLPGVGSNTTFPMAVNLAWFNLRNSLK